MTYLRTSVLARAVGIHPNTVRRYVDRGFLPPVEHSPSGSRRFTQRHLDCLRLARQVCCNYYPGKAILQSGMRIIQATVSGDLGGALVRDPGAVPARVFSRGTASRAAVASVQ